MTGISTIKKIACVDLSILLIISISNAHSYSYAANASTNIELNTESRTDEIFTNNSIKANEAYVLLIQCFLNSKDNVYTEEYGEYTVSGIYGAGFPEYYCGAYINTDGNLVIEINNDLDDAERKAVQCELLDAMNGYVPVFRNTEIPYRNLVLTMSEITELREGTYDPDIEYICTYSIDEYNSQVQIGVYIESSLTIDKVLSHLTYPEIVSFSKVDKPQPCLGNGSYGQAISNYMNFTNNYFSIGYRASYISGGNTIEGFVTCGHGFLNTSGTPVYYASNIYGLSFSQPIIGSLIGNLDYNRYVCTIGATIDAAFVELSSYSSVTNQVATRYGGTYTISSNSPSLPAIGSTVYAYGTATDDQYGYLRSGIIVSSSTTFIDINNPVFSVYDTIQTTCNIIPGDSGGPLFYSSSSGVYTICGINTGYDYQTLVYYGFHTKASNIMTQFGLSMY